MLRAIGTVRVFVLQKEVGKAANIEVYEAVVEWISYLTQVCIDLIEKRDVSVADPSVHVCSYLGKSSPHNFEMPNEY